MKTNKIEILLADNGFVLQWGEPTKAGTVNHLVVCASYEDVITTVAALMGIQLKEEEEDGSNTAENFKFDN